MEFLADIILGAGALAAGAYCMVLSRRLMRFNDLEKGVGGAVAVLSAQVDDLTRTLETAKGATDGSQASLAALTDRAEGVAKKLELMVASLHDVETELTAAAAPTRVAEPIFARRSMQDGV